MCDDNIHSTLMLRCDCHSWLDPGRPVPAVDRYGYDILLLQCQGYHRARGLGIYKSLVASTKSTLPCKVKLTYLQGSDSAE